MKKCLLFGVLTALFFNVLKAQQYNLESCIKTALQNDISIKTADLIKQNSTIDLHQAKSDRLPFAEMNYNLGQSYGRSIDPFSNDYVNQQLNFSNVGLNANVLLFNGFRLKNQIKKEEWAITAAEAEKKAIEDQLRLLVTQAYIQVLNNIEILTLSEQRAETTKNQLNQLEIAFKEGIGDPSTISDLKGQYASDGLQIIDAENQIKSAKLELCQIMNINYDPNMSLESLEEINPYQDDSPEEILLLATKKFAAFNAKEIRIQESEARIKIAKAAYYPSIFAFAGANSNFSSAARRFELQGTTETNTGDFIRFNNEEIPVLQRSNAFTESNISYADQLYSNISPNLGISVSIPIFSQFSQKNNIKRAELQLESAKLNLSDTKILFQQAIEQAYLNKEITKSRISNLESQIEAFSESLRINQVKLDNGVSNIVEYILSKNRLETSKLMLTNAIYTLKLQEKILEYYKGN